MENLEKKGITKKKYCVITIEAIRLKDNTLRDNKILIFIEF